jgi:hypothetical protein
MMPAGQSQPRPPDELERFVAEWDRLEAEYLERLTAACKGLSEWRERFRAAATETIRLAEENPLQARFMTVEALAIFDRIYRRFVTDPGPDLGSQLPELMFLAVSSYFGTEAGMEELATPP